MRHHLLTLLFLVLAGCGSADRSLELLSELDPADEIEGYRLKLGYSALVMGDMTDASQGKMIVERLVELTAWDEARYCAGHLLEANGQDATLHYLTAVCLQNQFQLKRAQEEINRAVALDAGNKKYQQEKARIASLLGIWQQIDSITDLLAGSADMAHYNARARLLVSMRRFQSANNDLNKSLAADAQNAEAIYLKGMALLYSHEYGGAVDQFNQLSQMELPAEQEKLYAKYEEAAVKLSSLDERLRSDPGETTVYLDFSRELSLIGDFGRALHMIESGLGISPDDPRLIQARILVYVQQGEMEKARQAIHYLESLGYQADPQLKELLN